MTLHHPTPYKAEPLAIPQHEPYVLANGDIAIIGNDGMVSLIEPLNAIFTDHHPGVRFHTTMRGSATAIPALAAGASIFAPMSRDAWVADRESFKLARGYEPTAIRIGYNGHGPRENAKNPPSFYVHAKNPLIGLTMTDAGRVFTSGAPEGDINLWGQLGLRGDYANRRIHLYGPRDDGRYATGLRDAHFGSRHFAPHYEPISNRAEVIRAVSQDPFGIAATGWFQAKTISDDVRIVPLARAVGEPFVTPELHNVAAGIYPLTGFINIYVDLPPETQLSPFIKSYLRLALSQEGQAIIAAQIWSPEGYIPLSPADLSEQLEKLENL